jgi:hypothetical protein
LNGRERREVGDSMSGWNVNLDLLETEKRSGRLQVEDEEDIHTLGGARI